MQGKRVLATNDLVFKKVFAGLQNSHVLIGFVNDILGLKVDEATIVDTYNIQSFYDEKGNLEGKAELILAMKKKGKDAQAIAEFIGMPKKEVEQFLIRS